jgi:hypothetical protein
MRQPKSGLWWDSEVAFIEAEASKGTARMGSFEEYCKMQARFAKLDGFKDLAVRIETAARSKS